MLLTSAFFLGLAAAAPQLVVSPPTVGDLPTSRAVQIINITAIGSGCPAGHTFANVDATGTIFDVAFDQFIAVAGPGTSAADARKNCRVSINLKFPQGLQFSVIDTRFSGYASLASDQTGTCRAAYTFSGVTGQESVYQKSIVGSYEDNYQMLAGLDIISWSKCGDSTAILNVNSEVRITPVSSKQKGSMTVDSFDGRLHVIFQTNWRSC